MNADPPKIEADPNLAAEQAQAQATLIANLQNQAQLDTSNIMARYGTQLALGGSGMAATPAAAPAAAPANNPWGSMINAIRPALMNAGKT